MSIAQQLQDRREALERELKSLINRFQDDTGFVVPFMVNDYVTDKDMSGRKIHRLVNVNVNIATQPPDPDE